MSIERQREDEVITVELGKIGVVQEAKEEFSDSLFQDVYKAAGILAAKIESDQREMRQKKCAIYEQPDNIITFVGRRGTGKSSSMFSFMDALKKIKNTAELKNITEEVHFSTERDRDIEFIGLEWIDASIMEKGEDIFEMLLAKMMGEVLKEDATLLEMDAKKDYRIKELHKKLGSIYQKVLKLKLRNTQQVYREESPISSLRELARSIDLRQEFEKLIESYLSVKSKGSYAQNSFLVVAIDDVDMNINYGFDILEQIQRYLKVKGLLVLLSIDYDQMLRCCEKHFKKLYEDDLKRRQVAESFITKVLPFTQRVYLPSLKKRDYTRKNKMLIKIGDQKCSIKKTIFKMIWERTKIQYDSQGRKRHFMEPNNLRDLNNYFLFLQGMPELEKDLPSEEKTAREERMKRMERNHRRMMDDLLFRFAEEYLPTKEKEYFISLSEEDIRRRGEIVVANFVRDVGKISPRDLRYTVFSDKYGSGQIHGFIEETEAFGYSFGQFIRCLYFMGREVIYDKKLVHALLAMYTSAMTRIFYQYRQKKLSQEETKGNYNMLKTLLGNSAAGSWSLYIMPMIKINETEMRFSGATAPVKLSGLKTPFIKDLNIIGNINCIMYEKADKRKKQLVQLMMQLKKEMMLLLFFSGISDSKSGYALNLKTNLVLENSDQKEKDPWQSDEKAYICLNNSDGIQFNVLNFINNIFGFEDCLENFMALLLKSSENNKYEYNNKDKVLVRSAIRELQKRDNFYKQMSEWIRKSGGAVIPFYSVDIYYNLLKRLAREQRQNPSIPIKKDGLFSQFLKLLQNIRIHLSRLDDFYDCQTNEDLPFVQIFESCPVIEYLKNEKEFPSMYNNYVYDMICEDDIGNRLQQMNDKMNFFQD